MAVSILKFVRNESMRFIAVYVYKPEGGKKDYVGAKTGWQTKTPEECGRLQDERELNEIRWEKGACAKPKGNGEWENYYANQVMIRPSNKYIVIDTDGEKPYVNLCEYLKDNGIIACMTDSFSKRTEDIYYKNHFWFKAEEGATYYNGCQNYKDCDIFYNADSDVQTCQVCEWLNTELDISMMPTMTKLHYDAIIKLQEPKEIMKLATQKKQITIFKELKTEESESDDDEDVPEEEQKIIELVDLLSLRRAYDTNDWLYVGSVLKAINEDYELIYDKFSKKIKGKYPGKRAIRTQWRSFKWGDLIKPMARLCALAKEDSPEGFIEWRHKWNKTEEADDSEEAQYAIMKEELEKRLFFVVESQSYYWTTDSEDLIRASHTSISRTILAPYKIGKRSFFNIWNEDPTRRSYDKMAFAPLSENERIYNSFKGFKYDTEKTYALDYIIRCKYITTKNELDDTITTKLNIYTVLDGVEICIHENIESDGKDRIIEYAFPKEIKKYVNVALFLMKGDITAFYDWVAWIRQYPNKKSNKCIVLYSDTNGVGKNTLVDGIRAVIGYDTKTSSVSELCQNFNVKFCDKLLIFGDEIKAKNKDLRDELKEIITRTVMTKEAKGIDSIDVADYANYIFTTNNEFAFALDSTDRRFIMYHLTETVMNTEIADDLRECYKNKEFLEAFDWFLKTRVLPKQIEIPKNNYRKLVISLSSPAYIHMLYKNRAQFYDRVCKSSELLELANNYAHFARLAGGFSLKKLAKDLKAEFPSDWYKHNKGFVFPEKEAYIKVLRAKRPEFFTDED